MYKLISSIIISKGDMIISIIEAIVSTYSLEYSLNMKIKIELIIKKDSSRIRKYLNSSLVNSFMNR